MSLIPSCSSNRGKIKQGKGGEIQSADVVARCEEPRKTYAKEIQATLKAEIDKLNKIPDIRLEAELRNKVIRLSDYSAKGLDLDLLLFRICEMSLNRGFTSDQTSYLIEIAIKAWSEKEERRTTNVAYERWRRTSRVIKEDLSRKINNYRLYFW
jgi:hypothetical protein